MNKISIITINYNNKIGLQNTINSVLSQTWKGFEFIIIDGGSNDGGEAIIENYKHQLTYYVSEPDKGVYCAMNKGIRAAKGDFVFFLNSGDLFYDDHVLERIEMHLDKTTRIHYGDVVYQEEHTRVTRTFPDKLTFDFFLKDNINHQACFIDRLLFHEIFFYNEDYKMVSDWEFLIYAVCNRNISYKHTPQLISIYDTTGMSSDLNNHDAMNEDKNKTIQKYFPLFIEAYDYLQQLRNKKIEQFLFVKQYPVAYKVLKACINTILLFLPKFKRTT
jgi:glycosyltransferase involved in cell wall biosynthesis